MLPCNCEGTEQLRSEKKRSEIFMDLMQEAILMGFSGAAVMDTKELVFVPEYRTFCEENLCGCYNLNPACPPASGTVEEMKQRALSYEKTLVLQTTQEDLHEVAGNVAKLNKARDQYLNTAQKISDAQFVQMQQEEDEIPDAIRRLEANEAYEAAIRRDMNYLEGEKQAWVYCMEEVKEEMHHLRIFSYVLFGVFIVLMALILVLQGVKNVDTKLMFTLLVSAAAIGGFFLYFRQQRDIDQLKRCEANINGAIILLNKIKFKYVNTKNAVDYACEKYHVHNSKELTYIWEQYQDAVREKEKYLQTNEELDYYNSRLVRRLKDYQLYDAKVWTGNPEAIYNDKEMVEVQHNLIARRQKLRERIEYNTKNILNMRKEVEEIAASQKQMVPELKEIIDSIDSLSSQS